MKLAANVLCGMEPEDLVHFMLTCEKPEEVRQPFISKLETLITSHHESHWWNQLGDWDMVQLLLDNTKLKEINEPTRLQIWDISRGLCYTLNKRSNLSSLFYSIIKQLILKISKTIYQSLL